MGFHLTFLGLELAVTINNYRAYAYLNEKEHNGVDDDNISE